MTEATAVKGTLETQKVRVISPARMAVYLAAGRYYLENDFLATSSRGVL